MASATATDMATVDMDIATDIMIHMLTADTPIGAMITGMTTVIIGIIMIDLRAIIVSGTTGATIEPLLCGDSFR
jgi:hypothetical protein